MRETKRRYPMIITCPKCTRRYQIDDNLLEAEGQLQRKLKCRVCTHTWVYLSSHLHNFSYLLAEDSTYPPQALGGTMGSASHTISNPPLKIGWILYFLTLFFLFTGLFLGKSTLIHLWPPISQLYNILGSCTLSM